MPNWCDNGVTLLHTDPAMLDRVRKSFNEERLFQEFLPLNEDAGVFDSRETWGTKWDVSPIEISERDGGVFLSFYTAWTPPIPFYEKLAENGFSITAYYFEPGCGFCGRFTHDEGESYFEIEDDDADWVRENIPTDIDTYYGISDMIDEMGEEDEQEN